MQTGSDYAERTAAERALAVEESGSLLHYTGFLRRLAQSKGAMVGLAILLLLVLMAVFAPAIAPYDPLELNARDYMQPPGVHHLFGADPLGRDVLSRVIFGARISLVIGTISVSIGMVLGTSIGLVSGYYGGWIDGVLMRIVEVMLAFPGVLLALVIVSILGPSLRNLMVAVGISSIPTYARLTRASALSAREELYVEAARVVGASDRVIAWRHILPNVVAPVIVACLLYTSPSPRDRS